MINRTGRKARALVGVALLLIAVGITACGSSSSSSSTASSTTSTSASVPAGTPATIRIAYQDIPNGDLVVKYNKWLEQAFPHTKIEWKVFQSGGDVNQAIAAGAVDLGLVGSSPVSRGISQSLPYKVLWIHDVIGSNEALVVKQGINSISDLEGKTVATPLASTSDFSLLAALKDAGIPQQKVKIIGAEPDAIVAAWSRGDIQGAYVWNPDLAKIAADGGKILTTSADLAKRGQTTYDLGVVTKSFAAKYPQALATWVTQEDRAVKLLQSNPSAAAQAIGAELNLSPAEALSQTKGLIFLTAAQQAGANYLGGDLAKQIYAQGQFNEQLGQIPNLAPQSTYLSAVDATPVTQVASGG
jgi:taurine transport system substrate-binding protein